MVPTMLVPLSTSHVMSIPQLILDLMWIECNGPLVMIYLTTSLGWRDAMSPVKDLSTSHWMLWTVQLFGVLHNFLLELTATAPDQVKILILEWKVI